MVNNRPAAGKAAPLQSSGLGGQGSGGSPFRAAQSPSAWGARLPSSPARSLALTCVEALGVSSPGLFTPERPSRRAGCSRRLVELLSDEHSPEPCHSVSSAVHRVVSNPDFDCLGLDVMGSQEWDCAKGSLVRSISRRLGQGDLHSRKKDWPFAWDASANAFLGSIIMAVKNSQLALRNTSLCDLRSVLTFFESRPIPGMGSSSALLMFSKIVTLLSHRPSTVQAIRAGIRVRKGV